MYLIQNQSILILLVIIMIIVTFIIGYKGPTNDKRSETSLIKYL